MLDVQIFWYKNHTDVPTVKAPDIFDTEILNTAAVCIMYIQKKGLPGGY